MIEIEKEISYIILLKLMKKFKTDDKNDELIKMKILLLEIIYFFIFFSLTMIFMSVFSITRY